MQAVLYGVAKILEIAGMLLMPLALWVGYRIEGGPGMVMQLKYLCAGVALFAIGRSLEAATAEKEDEA